ncbi:MAG: DNA translocase FtsK [Chloroflexi bacterium]|nr:DNA translocase FtsK [Chloroflexota bacterium]
MAKKTSSKQFQREVPPEQLPLPTLSRWQKILLALTRLAQGIARHGADIVAVLLLALAFIAFLGLFNLTNGWAVVWLSDALTSWLGWGAVAAPLSAAGIAVALLADNFGRSVVINWWRIIVGEVAFACGLALLQLQLGTTLAAASLGNGGGIVGWSLGLVFADVLDGAARPALGLLFLLCAAFAAGLTPSRILQWLIRLQARLNGEDFDDQPRTVVTVTAPKANTLVLDRPREKIKYTKRFTVEQPKDAKPAKTKKRDARLPGLEMLEDGGPGKISEADINRNAAIIEKTLADFGVPAKVIDFKTGPSVTQFAVEPGYHERGEERKYKVRVAQISSLANDLSLALSASPIRIEAPVPGHSYVGIEVPNRKTTNVGLRGVMQSEDFARINSPLAIALGRDVSGSALAADLAKMPHLLIAGTTGSGKSVCITSIITGLIVNNTPEDLRLVMIDPKMVELVRFNGLPHLYGKVEVELDRIVGTLRWATREMDRRYKLLESAQARDLAAYNQKTKRSGERLPRIVILIDELADLMLLAPDETEKTLVRLAQMARATGMHLVVATQRPSTDIVTGLIKANFPARISFAVASGVDSRVILDTPGAESLLGKGDMLFLSPEAAGPTRLQGCFVSDREVEKVVTFWKEQEIEEDEPAEEEKREEGRETAKPLAVGNAPWDDMLAREAVVEDKDSQIEQAIAIVKQYGTASASLLQRKMRIGYPRAARLMDELKEMGIVGREQTGGKTREVLIEKNDDPIGRRARIIGGEDDE